MADANGLGASRVTMSGGHAGAGQRGARRFPAEEMETLRDEMRQPGLDAWQAAEVLSGFLSGRGYGVSSNAARGAVERMEETGFTMESMQTELERMAMVM